MDIAIGIPCLLRGGTEIQTLYLAKALVNSLNKVTIVCYFEFDKNIVNEFDISGCNVVLMKMKREMRLARIIELLRKYFYTTRPDVVHVQYMSPGALPVLAARLAGIKHVFATVHQPYTSTHGIHAKIILRSAALLCDYFMAVSEVAEKSWFGSSGLLSIGGEKRTSKHFTLHNTVDVPKVAALSSPDMKRTVPVVTKLTTGFVFGYVGRLRHEKGVDILLEAFGRLSEKYSNIQLLVVGDGPDLPHLQERYSKQQWWEKVVFAGPQTWDDAMKHFSLMDVVVVPSRFEGFGLTAIEAMASSKPVIASNTGGLKEIIKNRCTGIHFESCNIDELYKAMLEIREDEELRSMLSMNAYRRSEDFSFYRYAQKIKYVYESIC